MKILDFGCGSGMFMRRARKRGHEVYGLDYSPYSEEAKNLFKLNITSRPLEENNFESNYFDVILSHATYEHLFDPIGISKKLLGYLKPNGLFIISGVPNFNTITIQIFKNFTNNGKGRVNHFEKKTIKLLFDKLNLKTHSIKTYGINIWLFISFIRKIFKSKSKFIQEKRNFKNDIVSFPIIRPFKNRIKLVRGGKRTRMF